jgi:RNA polymerase sigma factor (sigma-70 family)
MTIALEVRGSLPAAMPCTQRMQGLQTTVRGTLALDLAAPGNEAQRSVERISMIAALQEVPPRERAAMVLRFYLDYDYVTIACCLGTSTGTVGSRLSRGIDRLRPVLERSARSCASP